MPRHAVAGFVPTYPRTMSTSQQVGRRGAVLRWPLLAVGIATVLALAIVWLIAVPIGPEACALSFPGPRNCFTSDRVQAATLPTIVIIAAALLSVALLFAWPKNSRMITTWSVVLLLVMAAAFYVLVAWIPALAWTWRGDISP